MHFLPSTRADKICFIWLSEQTYFKHLYQYTITTETTGDGYYGGSHHPMENNSSDCVVRVCEILEKKTLTSGNWEVDGEKVDKKLVLIMKLLFVMYYSVNYKVLLAIMDL